MENVLTAGMKKTSAANISMCQMPLSFLKCGDAAVVIKVRGKNELHHHLENLGFVEGAKVKVLSETAGDLIVEVKGSQIALNGQVASHIIVSI